MNKWRLMTGKSLRRLFYSALIVWCALQTPAPAFAQAAPPPTATVSAPLVKLITEWDEFIGRFEAVDEVAIRARVSGYLAEIHFTDGELVKQGDPLFSIDRRQYDAALEEAAASVASAKARLDYAQGDLGRAEALRTRGNISGQGLDQRRQAALTARADLDRAEAELRQARLNIEFTQIKAPFAGRISRRLLSVGNLVIANETVLTNIVSLNPIHFYFDVDERSFLAYMRHTGNGTKPSSWANGSPVHITIESRNAPKIVGKMDFADNRLDAATGTIRARAVVENDDLTLSPGQFGRIRVMGSDEYQAVLLPDEAIGSDQDRRIVYVVDDNNQVSARPVRPGPRIDGYRVIREGLDGSETVVVDGLVRIRPGMKITPRTSVLPPTRQVAAN